MAEQTQNDEVEVLRRTNAELVTKNTTRKAKIAELEAANTELTAKLLEATSSLRAVTIDGPLKSMAESLSTVPELWIDLFNKSYRLEMVKGELTLLSTDGKPVQQEGKSESVPFEAKALTELLTTGDDATSRAFHAITITSKASGASSTTQRSAASTPKAPAAQFGLR